MLYTFIDAPCRLAVRWIVLLTLTCGLYSNSMAQTPCVCTNCPQFMPDNFVGSFLINIQNATNPTLGQNGQGVCGVNIHFEHEYLGDLRITLTSPSGQTVTLIGPIGFFGGTDGTVWDVSFLPCGDPVSPDPGFSNVWNNNQAWGLNGNYNGSYYPSIGCLQNFTGPVNGTWSLTVTDGQAVDVGTFFNYEIIFCDPSGIDCFSCNANAGNLLQPDVTACEGSAALNLTLPPTWTPASAQPPASEYSYTYVIAGAGGVILDFSPTPDMTSYPPGPYTICGMSFLTAQASEIPIPNGTLTVQQLTAQLSSTTAPFCGRITTNCVNVTINTAPPDEELTETICAPACYIFNGIPRCSTGVYTATLLQNGCPYNATLNLTVNQPITVNMLESICPGECSSNPAFPAACSPGTYQTILTRENGCDSIVRLTVQQMQIEAATGPLPQVPCSGASVLLQGTGSSIGAGVTYAWSASNGGNITGPNNTINTTINAAGDYKLLVCRTQNGNTCCDSVEVSISSQTDPPLSPIQINGNSNICQGQTFTYTTAPVTGSTSYQWTVPPGVTVNSGGTGNVINLTWGIPESGEICVASVNACGTSVPTCLNVNVNSIPVVTIPMGTDTVCAGDISVFSIPEVTNASNYFWTVTPPNTIVSGQNTNAVEISWVGGTSANVCVRATNTCGASPIACKTVSVGILPVAPNLNGATTVCAGTTANYNIAAVIGASSYTWTVTGGTIVGPSTGTVIQVAWDPGASSGSVCVRANSLACGSSPQTCQNITINPLPASPVISGNAALCEGTTATYSIPSVAGATGYTWTVPSGGTITAGQGTTQITVNWATAPGGNVCVGANSNCGTSPQSCFPVVVSAVPVANAGTDQDVCITSTTLAANTGIGSGQWTTVSGAGTATFDNPTSPASNVTVTTPGDYLFRWTLINATCTDDDEVAVEFNTNPTNGIIQPLCDATNENYTISFSITGGESPYTVPNGTVANGVFTSNPIPNNTPYSFQITDANGCQSAVITGSFNCNCATNAGTMSSALLTACSGETITAQHNNNATLDANDIGVFVLHQGSGTGLISPIATNTTGTFGFQTGMTYGQTYYVSYVVGNNLNGAPNPTDPCRSVAQGQPVVFYQNPTANAGTDVEICGLTLSLAANAAGGPGIWSVSTTPSGATLNLADQTSPTSGANASVFGTYTLVWTVTTNGCSDTDEVVASYNSLPAAGLITDDCNNTNTQYTVTIPITGGLAPYSINGNQITGNTFTSGNIASGSPYSFVIVDANNCSSAPVAGLVNCNCATSAGTMSLTTLTACPGDSVVAQHNTGSEVLDGDDIVAYVLHEGSGPAIVNPVATNTTGVFQFQSGMVYGQTYYISLVAGNNLNGIPNAADPCLDVAQGQPVIFYDNPTPNPGPDQSVCGQTLALAAIGTGTWSVVAGPGQLTIADPTNPATDITASTFGNYTLTWTVVSNGCVSDATVSASFNSNPTLSNLTRTCDSANENFNVQITLANGTLPYSINGTNIAGNVFTSPPLPNGQAYSYTVSDANGCTMPAITGSFSCNCASDPGTMSASVISVCEDAQAVAVANNDANLDANDVIGFVLHTGQGGALGTVIDQNTTGIFSFEPTSMDYGVTYYISRIIGNPLGGQPNPADPCFGVAPGQPVVFLQIPQPTAGVNQVVCGTSAILNAVQGSFVGTWSTLNGPGSLSFDNPGTATSTVTASTTGTYNLVWQEANSQCIGRDTVQLRFNEIPIIGAVDETCNNVNTAYTVTLTISGGSAPYVVNGLSGTFAGSNFTSAPIGSTLTYNITFTDTNGCTTAPLSGSKNCNCTTDAGSMITTPAVFCADDPAVAVWNNDGAFDGDDILRYILHTQSGSTPGQILATSNNPSFAFGGGLQVNTTYYISAMVGSALPNGQINLNDDCLSVAPGTPVRWKSLPTATLTGTSTICEGLSAPLNLGGTGTFPLTLSYTTSTSTNGSWTLNNPTSTIDITPLATISYLLTGVSDGTLPTCSTSLNIPVTITVVPKVEAGTPTQELDICQGSNVSVLLAGLLANSTPGGVWENASSVPLPAGVLNAQNGTFFASAQPVGRYEFRYRLSNAPCPDDEAVVVVHIRELPVADAGADRKIDCDVLAANLGGNGTSQGSSFDYRWTRGTSPAPVDTNRIWETTTGGIYTLLVTNSFGCTATDVVEVIESNEEPVVNAFVVNDIRCYGELNGSIQISDITGGIPPYRIALNNGPLMTTSIFGQLEAGSYSIRVEDANGCETTIENIMVNEPEQVMIELGPDLSLRLGDSVEVEAILTIPDTQVDTLIWTPLLDPAGAGTRFQRYFPIRTETLQATVIDTNGCEATSNLYIFLDRTRQIYVPNIFDPSQSGNNVVTVYAGQDVEEIELFRIYDRWGELVHEAKSFAPGDESKGWNGQMGSAGRIAQPAVFVWTALIRFKDGEVELFSGDVSIAR
jgi:subtilisin-like proprotein convertase family protein